MAITVQTSVGQQPSSCLGIVLAGGLSSRMGQDKSQLVRNTSTNAEPNSQQTETMLAFSQSLLNKAGIKQVVISGGEHGINDLVPQLGPVGGIYSVFEQVPCSAALIIPVDLPLMTAEVLASLIQAGQISKKAVHFNHHSLPLYLPNNGYTELFFNQQLTNTNISTSVAGKGGKGPSIKSLLKQVPHQTISCPQPQTLTNTNTPEQWQSAQVQLSMPTRSF